MAGSDRQGKENQSYSGKKNRQELISREDEEMHRLVQLLIQAIMKLSSHVAAVQGIKSCKHSPAASRNVHIKHPEWRKSVISESGT